MTDLFGLTLLTVAVSLIALDALLLRRIGRMERRDKEPETHRYAVALSVEAAKLRRERDELRRKAALAEERAVTYVAGLERDVENYRRLLTLERTINDLLTNVLTEISEQTAKNDMAKSMPSTTLSVIEVAAAEAVRTVKDWRETGQTDPGEVTNARATLANALLPEPDPKAQPDCTCKHRFDNHLGLPDSHPWGRSSRRGRCLMECNCVEYQPARGVVTERKRDGRVGDTGFNPFNPDRYHLYDYGLRAAGPGFDGLECGVRGCGRHHGHPVHHDRGFSQTVTMAGTVSSGFASALPKRHVYVAQQVDVQGKQGLCAYPGCGRGPLDAIHRPDF